MEATSTLALSSSPAAARRSPEKAAVASLYLRRFPTTSSLHLRAVQSPASRSLFSLPGMEEAEEGGRAGW
ncbi:signal recognition particle 54 kDa protein, chloroplastic-like [Panicum miliaceum]|uniref:Signal recognition particle 54 kDa protein, chloroplastic-like n=1 Tax=Panicum miliaceum TaxID=4540 RepID=A0A3L6RKD8_PANMI|nr:signal recognition particle 54 kDa protein, chloroplastic-like [Panicum miliaceum]